MSTSSRSLSLVRGVSLFNRLKQSPFLKSVAVLASGAAVAQLVMVAVSPLLTRLYSPEAFGLYATFLAFVTTLLPVVSGKYEVAMMLPKMKHLGLQVLGICFLLCFLVSSTFLLALFLFKEDVVAFVDASALGRWLYLAPLALLTSGVLQALTYFCNRNRTYGFITQARLVQACCTALVSVALGWYSFGFVGLVVANIFATLLAGIYLLRRSEVALFRVLFLGWKKKRVLKSKYRDYPMYNASTGLLNGITASLPVFFLAHYFPEAIVGYFALIQRIVNTPLSYVSGAVSQVNLKQVVELVQAGKNVTGYLLKVAGMLCAIVLIPALVVALFAPSLFSFIFGADWHEAGVYAQILMPALAVKFIVSTLSSTIGATNNNRLCAKWNIGSFSVTLLVYYFVCPLGDARLLFQSVMVTEVVLYTIYFMMILWAAKRPKLNFAKH